jgi:hypothetical protein
MREGKEGPTPNWVREVKDLDKKLHDRGAPVDPEEFRTPKSDMRSTIWEDGDRLVDLTADYDMRPGRGVHRSSRVLVNELINEGDVPVNEQVNFVTHYEIKGPLDEGSTPDVKRYHYIYDPDDIQSPGEAALYEKNLQKNKKAQRKSGQAELNEGQYGSLLDLYRQGVEKTESDQ